MHLETRLIDYSISWQLLNIIFFFVILVAIDWLID